jgi:hypothetical protein
MGYMNETQRGMMHSDAKRKLSKTGRAIGSGIMKTGAFLFSSLNGGGSNSRPIAQRRYR